jgi:hypothetical protein
MVELGLVCEDDDDPEHNTHSKLTQKGQDWYGLMKGIGGIVVQTGEEESAS